MASSRASSHGSNSSSMTRKSVRFDTSSYSSDYDDSTITNLSLNEITKQEDAIRTELSHVTKPFNLLLCMIYGLLCLNWYIIGSQWFPYTEKVPEIECDIEELHSVIWTFYEKRNITTPKSDYYEPGCIYYDFNYYYLATLTLEEAQEHTSKQKDTTLLLFCKKYNIRQDIPMEVSFVKEFGLICFKKPFQRGNFYMAIGQLFMAFPAGVLADIYGRKPVHIFCSVIATTMSIIIALSPNFGTFAIAKTIQGGCIAVLSMMLHLLHTEICRRRFRTITTISAFLWFMVGAGQHVGLLTIIKVWRFRAVTLGLLLLVDTLSALMFLPESPRYLLVKRMYDKAWDVLIELGSTQARPDNLENYETYNNTFRYQFKILTREYLVKRVIIVLLLNNAGVYYYVIFTNMSMKIMVKTNILQIEIVAVAISLLIATMALIPKFTLKTVTCIHFALLALCFIGRIIGTKVLLDITSLAGIMLANVIFILTFSLLIDIFPTTHRGTVMGFSLSIHFLIATIVNVFYDEMKLDEDSKSLNAFYCTMCLICALISVLSPDCTSEIPDTKHDLFRILSLETSNQSSSSSTI